MSKVSQMNLREIFAFTGILLQEYDIYNFCNDQAIIEGYLKIYDKNNLERVQEYLIKHGEKIDKEKIVFCLYLNYQHNLSIIKEKIEALRKNPSGNWEEIKKLTEQQKIQGKNMELTAKLGKDLDTYQAETYYEDGKVKFEILSSREEFQKRRKSEKRKLERWESMENAIEGEGGMIVYILQPLILSDLQNILPDAQTALKLREAVLVNALLKEKHITIEQLENLREKNDEKYVSMIDGVSLQAYLPELKEALEKNIRFMDIDKLLLMCAYRFEEYLEQDKCNKQDTEVIVYCMAFIANQIENKNIRFKERLSKLETYEPMDVEYSFQDITKCIDRFIGDTYIPKSRITQAKEDLLAGSIQLDALEKPILDLIDFNEDEIKIMMDYGEENFIYGIEMLQWDEKQIVKKLIECPGKISVDLLSYLYHAQKITADSIVQLYTKQMMDAEFFKEFSEKTDFFSEINLQKINQQYFSVKKQTEQDQEAVQKLYGLIELYIILNLEGKSEEELQEASDNLMYEIAEDFEDEEDILFYFQKGLITLNTVAEWSGDSFIEKLYNESTITYEQIENLYHNGKIGQQLIEKITLERQDLDYTDLMRCIYAGYLSENKIINFYMQGKIFDVDLEEITRQGRISISRFKEATSKRTKEALEEYAQIKLEPTLVNIPDKKIQVNLLEETTKIPTYRTHSRTKTLIDPNARYEFLELLGAKKANAIIPDEENAFYNYEFFVIPNEDGKLDINSVVIAERFYQDKEAKTEFAVDNATYFFQYKDLMVNSNLRKTEMIQNRENIVFTASHRAGSWAVRVLYRIAQTRASSNFKEYKKGDERTGRVVDELLKIYSLGKFNQILDMAGRIDDTNEFIYEEVNSTYAKSSEDAEPIEL